MAVKVIIFQNPTVCILYFNYVVKLCTMHVCTQLLQMVLHKTYVDYTTQIKSMYHKCEKLQITIE